MLPKGYKNQEKHRDFYLDIWVSLYRHHKKGKKKLNEDNRPPFLKMLFPKKRKDVIKYNINKLEKCTVMLEELEIVTEQLRKLSTRKLEYLYIYLNHPKSLAYLYFSKAKTVVLMILAYLAGKLEFKIQLNELIDFIFTSNFLGIFLVVGSIIMFVIISAIIDGNKKFWKRKQITLLLPDMIKIVLEEKYRSNTEKIEKSGDK